MTTKYSNPCDAFHTDLDLKPFLIDFQVKPNACHGSIFRMSLFTNWIFKVLQTRQISEVSDPCMCWWYCCPAAGERNFHQWSYGIPLSNILWLNFSQQEKPTARHCEVLIWSEIHWRLALSLLRNIIKVKVSPWGAGHQSSRGCRGLFHQWALRIAAVSWGPGSLASTPTLHVMPRCWPALTTAAFTKHCLCTV